MAADYTHVAFLRAIGPATHKVMPMTAFRDACAGAGLANAKTFIATGNLLFTSLASERDILGKISGVVSSFGLGNEAYVRTKGEIAAILSANPMPDAAQAHPNHLLVLMLDKAVDAQALEAWPGPERIIANGRDIYIDYPLDVGHSKLTPSVIERRLGARGTARNWNTMTKLNAKF